MKSEPDRINHIYDKYYIKNTKVGKSGPKNNFGNILMQNELYREINDYFIQNKFNFKKKNVRGWLCKW